MGDIGALKLKIVLKLILKKLVLKVWTGIKLVRSLSGGLFCCGASLSQSVQCTGYGLVNSGVAVLFPTSARDLPLSPPSLLLNEYRKKLSPGMKRLGCEADHLPACSAEFKNLWSYTRFTPSWRAHVHFKGHLFAS